MRDPFLDIRSFQKSVSVLSIIFMQHEKEKKIFFVFFYDVEGVSLLPLSNPRECPKWIKFMKMVSEKRGECRRVSKMEISDENIQYFRFRHFDFNRKSCWGEAIWKQQSSLHIITSHFLYNKKKFFLSFFFFLCLLAVDGERETLFIVAFFLWNSLPNKYSYRISKSGWNKWINFFFIPFYC